MQAQEVAQLAINANDNYQGAQVRVEVARAELEAAQQEKDFLIGEMAKLQLELEQEVDAAEGEDATIEKALVTGESQFLLVSSSYYTGGAHPCDDGEWADEDGFDLPKSLDSSANCEIYRNDMASLARVMTCAQILPATLWGAHTEMFCMVDSQKLRIWASEKSQMRRRS